VLWSSISWERRRRRPCRRSAADDDDVGWHFGMLDVGERFAEDQHGKPAFGDSLLSCLPALENLHDTGKSCGINTDSELYVQMFHVKHFVEVYLCV